MSEAEFDVDAAEAKYNASRADAGDDPGGDADDGGDKGDDDKGGDPPGFKTYDEYVADGGDPDMYRGKKAYAEEHTRISENKRLRKDVRGLQDTAKLTMEAVTSWKAGESAKMRKELDAKLKKNKEDEDIDGALDTQKEIDALENDPAPAATQDEHPVIQDFRDANPMLDTDHDDFDQEFNDDVEAFYNGLYQQLSYGGKRKVSDGQIKRALKRSLKEARELHEMDDPPPADEEEEGRGESRRNTRKRGRQRSQRRAPQQRSTTPTAEDFKIENPKNNRDHDATGVRDMVRDTAYKNAIKAGKSEEDATKAGATAAQNFEKSLSR